MPECRERSELMRLTILCLIALTIWASPLRAQVEPEEMQAVAEGAAVLNDDVAAAEEEAVWDAKRNAVEQAVGVFVQARTVGRNFELEEDEVRGRSDGFVRRWEIVPESEHVQNTGAGRILRLKVRAVVALMAVIRRLS